MDQDAQSSRKSIIACIAAVMSMSTTLGLSWPLLAIVLENRGVDPWLNGLSASSQMAAILVIMPVAPRLIARLGLSRAVGCGIVGMAASLALIPLFDDVWLWFPIRFAIGLFGELIFIAGDIWINRLATEQTRGRLIGVYSVFVHSGFAVGPLAIMWLNTPPPENPAVIPGQS